MVVQWEAQSREPREGPLSFEGVVLYLAQLFVDRSPRILSATTFLPSDSRIPVRFSSEQKDTVRVGHTP
jgi:hypothetical protein